MGLRGIVFWPVYRVADWIDANPVSAVGAFLALAAIAALAVSAFFGVETGGEMGTADVSLFFDTAIERPAYSAIALLGILVLLFYKG